MGSMRTSPDCRTSPHRPGDLTVQQLLERERSLRVMASTALTVEESTALLVLVEHYESLATERQTQNKAQHC
jgi:hypothetical protein